MQGRFKRDDKGSPQAPRGIGEASAEPEPRGVTDRGSSPQRVQSSGQTPGDHGSELGSGSQPSVSGGADGTDRPRPKGPTGPGRRIALRNWRISTRLVSLLALPVVAATTLGALRIDSSLDNIEQLDHMKLLTEMTQQATQLADALQEERDKSAGPLAGTGKEKDDRVVSTREKTTRAISAFKRAIEDVDQSDSTMIGVQSTLVDINQQLDKIRTLRDDAYGDREYVAQTVQSYNELITSLLALSQDMAQATSNRDMIQKTRALATFSSAKEYASMQRAIISAGLANPKGPRLSSNDLRFGKSALEKEDDALGRFTQIRGPESASTLLAPLDGGRPDITAANKYAERVMRDPNGITSEDRSYMDWYDQDSIKLAEMSKIERTLLTEMEQKARELRDEAEQEAWLNGALILLVLGVSLVGAFVVARSMVRSLRRLQDTAQEVAQKRLPELVKQLSESDPQDVDTSVESVGVHSRDEIGKVAAAFDDVHREAVRLAAEQALLRGNVNAMFTNLSRRSQGLIQRQLSLISELESREADPDQLSSLFKLDHLATRMRRNGENLLVLAGEEPGRRWTRPVPLVDVLRAAASEVEQYERIELSAVPSTEVAGRVVNDLVHLLAELLENATSFSSPQTKVKVTGHALPDGRVLVEIHDTGIGLSPEDLAAINERLASPPTVDVSVSRRMGLFVVGRLSLRHGIRIQLRPSDSGGTTALVMLPVDVAQGGKKPGAAAGGKSGAPSGPGAPVAGGTGGGAGLLGSAPSRRQVPGSGARPALPGSGLPQRPVGGGSGAPNGGRTGTSTGASLFESGRPPGDAPGAPRGAGAAGGRPALPVRGGDAAPVAPPTGTPARTEPPADRTGRPQLPQRGPAPELPGTQQPGTQQPGTSWGARRAAAGEDDWPTPQRDAADSPRGHDEADAPSPFSRPETGRDRDLNSTGQFNRSELGQGPGDTGQFARPDLGQGPGDTGQFPQPQFGDSRQGGPSDTGQFARPELGQGPGDTGQFPQPQLGRGPGDTGQFPQPRFGESETTGNHRMPAGPSDTGQFPQPQLGQGPGDTGQFARPELGQGPGDTGQFPQPHRGGPRPGAGSGGYLPQGGPGVGVGGPQGGAGRGPGDTGEFPRPSAVPNGLPADDPSSLPPAGPGDGRTPIFDTIESNWFSGPQSGGAGGQGRRDTASGPSAPSVPPAQGRAPRPAPQGPGGNGSAGAAPSWRTSPNDERWRRAEQVREPAAGGVTSSGLPRRVPRANLVEGTAQQQPQQSGPQVSRAPDEVRGRLTNLRRGIQQGRQATGPGNGPDGNHDRGIGPTYQQER
ncbi:nitrate- and nitrite sensing domain-containing protein [Streptomyces sp. P1-3]|uniref:sensor histidine kinase n=1 Tax=Streptomyces sp. P1-3 TaxID=3421658 RepID=UPI003D36C50E